MRPAVIAALAFAGCARTPAPAPSDFALLPFDALDVRCTTCSGAPGIPLDGTCLAIAMRSGGWSLAPPPPETDPQIVAAIARAAPRDRVALSGGPAVGDGAVFLEIAHAEVGRRPSGELVRVEFDGPMRSIAMPWGFAYLTFLPGPRPRLIAVLHDTATLVFDARTLAPLASWKLMGAWFNATTYGASVSPDAAWFAVPDPYRDRIHIVRAADLTLVASRQVGDLGAPCYATCHVRAH